MSRETEQKIEIVTPKQISEKDETDKKFEAVKKALEDVSEELRKGKKSRVELERKTKENESRINKFEDKDKESQTANIRMSQIGFLTSLIMLLAGLSSQVLFYIVGGLGFSLMFLVGWYDSRNN